MVAGSNPAGGAIVMSLLLRHLCAALRRFAGELAAITPFTGVFAATSFALVGCLRCSDTAEQVVNFLYDSFIYNDSGECRAT